MKRKKIIIAAVITLLILIITGFLLRDSFRQKNNGSFKLGEVKRGDLENIVSSTGTLSANGTVDLGAQVSGTIEKVFVDFNDRVKKGQVLAVLDTGLFKATVQEVEAGVMKARAQLRQAESKYNRNLPLFKNGYLSEMEFLVYETDVDIARATLQSAQASLKRAQMNLEYTKIRSPIDGTVIERSIDAGQTIAASFQTPTLFVIAEDLTQMQIEVNVDESDIGQIKKGQSVRFTVQAYPDDIFYGVVRQIRLKPETIQNVVNYTVIVGAENKNNLLLPGMTATVDFLIMEKKYILLVPNQAINFKPNAEMFAKYNNQIKDRLVDGSQKQLHADQMSSSDLYDNMAHIFYIDENGKPDIAVFSKGATDGVNTEVKDGLKIKEGMKVITGFFIENKKKRSNIKMPFMAPPGDRRKARF